MPPGVAASLTRHGGLITRVEALDLGLSPERIQAELRHGGWVWVRRGVYADAAVWQAADDFRARPRLRARAAVLAMKRSWVLSHDSAAHELGLDILRPDEPFVHVTRPGFTNAWTKYGVKHHLARFRPEQVLTPDGYPALDLARTAVDIARERAEQHGIVACDSAMRMGVTREQLREAAAPMVSWPFRTRIETCIDLGDPGAASVHESLGRELVLGLGIGPVETQFPLRFGDGRIVYADLRVGNHLFECDGRVKYVPAEDGGVALVPVEQVIWEEKKRERLVAAEGLGVSRILWEDHWGVRREGARRRLRAEYDVSRKRFGPVLDERLARNAREIRGQRGA